jgi:predicted nucleic acid-binding protein
MAQLVFVDSWGWVALGNRRDARHLEIKDFYRRLLSGGGRVFTSDYVLDEVVTILFKREVFEEAIRFIESILAAAGTGTLVIERITSARFAEAWKLRKRFQDKPKISFTDLTSMAVMRELSVNEVLTEDEHFTHVGMNFKKVP